MRKFYLLTALMLLVGSHLRSQQSDFYDINTIQEISIEFPGHNWRYVLDSLRFNGDQLLPATVKVNGKTLPQAGVRYRSGRAFTPGGRRNGLYIQLDAFKPGQTYAGQQAIDLSSALRDPSLVREVLALEMARNYMAAPRANYAKVSINGEAYGLFVNQEPVGPALLQRQFGNSQGTLYHADTELLRGEAAAAGCLNQAYGSLQAEQHTGCYSASFQLRQGKDFTSLELLARRLAEGGRIDDLLNVDATLWMLALNNLLVNLHSYSGQYAYNYYLYRNEEGRFEPIAGDMNLAFGSFKNTGATPSDLELEELIRLDPLLHVDNASRPLIRSLLAVETYRKVYLHHLRTLLVEQFAKGKFNQRAQQLQALIRPVLAQDDNRYYTLEEFDRSLLETIGKRSRIPGLTDFMDKRIDWLKHQEVYTILPPAITEVGVDKREPLATEKLAEFRVHAKVGDYAKLVQLHYRFDEGEFTSIQMYDDGNHYDGAANDGVYGAAVAPASAGTTAMQYYIAAENVKATAFSPSRYMFEPYTATLTEVNQ